MKNIPLIEPFYRNIAKKDNLCHEWIISYFKFSEELIYNKTTRGSVQVSQPPVAHSTSRITGHHTANQVTECVCSPLTLTQTHIPTCTNQPKAMLSFIADKLHIDFTVWTGDWGIGWAGELTIEFSPRSDDRIPAVLLCVRRLLPVGIFQVAAHRTIFNTYIVCMCDLICGGSRESPGAAQWIQWLLSNMLLTDGGCI